MALSTTENEDVVALHDTTSGQCFGPAFYTNSEAEAFLDWLKENAEEGNAFEVDGATVVYKEDARTLSANELMQAVQNYRDENDED